MMPFPFYQAPAPTYAPAPRPPQPMAPQAQANPYRAPASNGWQAMPQPVLAAQAAEFNQPRTRGYAPEAPSMPAPRVLPAPRRLKLPTPEELGLGAPNAAVPVSFPATVPVAVDWNATHARLRDIGAVGFHLERLPGGATRVRVLLPSAQPGQEREVEAIASSDAAALVTLFERIGR